LVKEVSGFKFQVPRFKVPSSKFQVPSSRFQVQEFKGSRFKVQELISYVEQASKRGACFFCEERWGEEAIV